MSDQSQKTEQPTKKRLDKARKEGRFAVSREFVSALQFVAALIMLSSWSANWFAGLRRTTQSMMMRAFEKDLSAADLVQLGVVAMRDIFVPIFTAGGLLLLITLGIQLSTTKLGFSMQRLAPAWNKMSPFGKLKQLPKQNLFATVQLVATLVLCSFALYTLALRNANDLFLLPVTPLDSGTTRVFDSIIDLMWRAAMVFMIFGCIDLFRQIQRHNSEMRMSKQEIREESKEMEGSPLVKSRIRRLQRALRQRKMLQAVPTATAVIVNPTHFAIAIKYEIGAATAPMVVAKGKNHLALRIRRLATEHSVPIVENPPLAQALYKSAGLNSEIPPHFYRAIAEVLAFVFQALNKTVAPRSR